MKRILWNVAALLCGLIIGVIYMIYRCGYILDSKQKKAEKYFAYFNLLEKWMTCKEQNYKLADYFHNNNIVSVAIYGMGKVGKHLKHELEKVGIAVSYVIDEGEGVFYGKEEHYNLRDKLPDTDIVIVTPIEEFEDIKKRIVNNNEMLNVISFEELVDILKAEYCCKEKL